MRTSFNRYAEMLESRVQLSAGQLDPGFGSAGFVAPDLAVGAMDRASDVAAQPDGKVVVAAVTEAGQVKVLRYRRDGSIDSAFGTNGIVTLASAGEFDQFRGRANVFIDNSGAIVLNAPNRTFRLTSSGALDRTFDGDGILQYGIYVLAVDSQRGLIYSEGEAILRLRNNGSKDLSFGTAGRFELGPVVRNEYVYEVYPSNAAIRPDGRIVIAATLFNGPGYDVALVQLTSSGRLDRTFGGNN